ANEWFDLAVEAFNFAHHARYWFQEGTLEQKRTIFSALGSNLSIKGQKLAINLNFPLAEIKRMIAIAPEIAEGFEPKKSLRNTRKSPSFEMKIPSLLRG